MDKYSRSEQPRFGGPATYRIVVRGKLGSDWSDRFGGMRISDSSEENEVPTTTLTGRIRDQAELGGVMDALCDMHLTILKLEQLGD